MSDLYPDPARFYPPGVWVHADYIEIPLRNRQGEIVRYALVDREDADRVLAVGRWSPDSRGYAIHNMPRPYGDGPAAVKMHRFILGLSPGDPGVDHGNGDHADNRKFNLRPATQVENGLNLDLISNRGRSRYRGVTFHQQTGKWRAALTVHGRRVELGLHVTEEDAAAAVRTYVVEHVSFFARHGS